MAGQSHHPGARNFGASSPKSRGAMLDCNCRSQTMLDADACRQYGTEYVGAEEAARAAGRGLWGGSFETPSDWRKERRIEQLQQSLSRDRTQRRAARTANVSSSISADSANDADRDDCVAPRRGSLGAKIGALCRRLLSGGGNESSPAASSESAAASSVARGPAIPADVVAALGRLSTLPPSPDCVIKGNISSGGHERIYHVPNGAAYERTQIDPAAGERWFCSEAEAQAAGWRRAKS